MLDQMLSSFGGADSQQCDQETSHIDPSRLPGPTIAIGSDERPSFAVLEIAEPIQLCLWGFAAGDPITVTVLYPDGRVRSSLGYPPAAPPGKPPCTGPGCYSHVNWAAVPGDPLGDYQVTAVQGGLRATGTVRVVPTSVRRLLVVGNGIDEGQYQTFRRGATVPIVAAGYGPVRDVELFIYHTPERVLQRGGTELHLLTWVRLRADSRGEFMYGLRTAAGDPAGCYALDTRPRAQALAPVLEVYRPTHTTVLNDKDSAPLFCLS